MPHFDLLVRGGVLVTPGGVAVADLGVSDGVVAAIAEHHISPHVGRRLRGRVVRTVLRGRTVYADGRIVAEPAGRLLVPTVRSAVPRPEEVPT